MRRPLIPFLAGLAAIGAAATDPAAAVAQEMGGLRLAPSVARGPSGLALPLSSALPPLPLITAQDLHAGPSAADRRAQHRDTIARLRGDAGYLAGFSFGEPLAPSVQRRRPAPPIDTGIFFLEPPPPVVINNFDGPVAIAVGDGNAIQQQTATGSGPIALQQVATLPGGNADTPEQPRDAQNRPARSAPGGATNLVLDNGSIVQRAEGAARPRAPGASEHRRRDRPREAGRRGAAEAAATAGK